MSLDFIHFIINIKKQTQGLLTKPTILLQWFPVFWNRERKRSSESRISSYLAPLNILLLQMRIRKILTDLYRHYQQIPVGGSDKGSLLDQTLVKLLWALFVTRPWPWPQSRMSLHSPVLARILGSQLSKIYANFSSPAFWSPWSAFSENLVR